MTKPTDEMIQKAKTVLKAVRGRDDRCAAVMEKLGAFFPHAPYFAWLDSDQDRTVGAVFTSAEGGWLGPAEDTELWRLLNAADPGARQGQPTEELVVLLERIVAIWQSRASAAAQPAVAGARFVSIEPVPGGAHPGWWQGYDNVEKKWKYVETGAARPDDRSSGWADQLAAAAAVEPVAVKRFGEIQPVPGEDYPGWWQGYDSVEKKWKYVHAGDIRPDDQTSGWTSDLVSAETARAAQPEVVAAVVKDAVAEMIKDVRALDVTEEALTDLEIVEALQAETAAAMAAG